MTRSHSLSEAGDGIRVASGGVPVKQVEGKTPQEYITSDEVAEAPGLLGGWRREDGGEYALDG